MVVIVAAATVAILERFSKCWFLFVVASSDVWTAGLAAGATNADVDDAHSRVNRVVTFMIDCVCNV